MKKLEAPDAPERTATDRAVTDRAAADRALLAERIAAIPAALAQAAAASPPAELAQVLAARRFVVTGGGLSEGPARVLVALLQRQGRAARFVPLSTFAEPQLSKPVWPGREQADPPALILFSQGLAPNAQLPLAHLRRFSKTLVFTSVDAGSAQAALKQHLAQLGVLFWTHPPAQEAQLLLRVLGPAVALFCALRFMSLLTPASAATQTALAELPARYAAALAASAELELFGGLRRPIALVGGEALCELAFPLRWKLLEGLRVPDPPVWELLQIVHGPLQSFFDSPLTLLLFASSARPHEHALIERLAGLLEPTRHHLLRIPYAEDQDQDPGHGILLLDACLNAALLRTLAEHPLELSRWPLRGADGPLYDLAPDSLKIPKAVSSDLAPKPELQ